MAQVTTPEIICKNNEASDQILQQVMSCGLDIQGGIESSTVENVMAVDNEMTINNELTLGNEMITDNEKRVTSDVVG